MFYIAVFAVLTFLYTIPFIPKRKFLNKQSNLRNIGGLKVFLIALVWVGVTVFIPLLNNHFSIDRMVVTVSVQRFLLVIMLMLPFEIRDLQFDSLKLYTIPQNLGVKRTKILGIFLGLLMFVLEFLKREMSINQIIVLLTILVLTVLLIWFSREKQGRYYAAFWNSCFMVAFNAFYQLKFSPFNALLNSFFKHSLFFLSMHLTLDCAIIEESLLLVFA